MHNATSLSRRIRDSFSSGDQVKPNSRLKVLNLTRQTVLADCVEVADHGAARRKGLLGRSELPTGEGLWIVPCESVHTFGMKFPIDLVYLDRRKKVKKVRSDVPAWRLSACLTAHSVLELASGTVHTTQTMPGDTLEFSPALPLDNCRFSSDAFVSAGSKPGNKQATEMLMQPKKLQAIAEFLVVGICTLLFAFTIVGFCASVFESHAAGTSDFVEYWASGHQLAHRANPYDEGAILRLERSAGFPYGDAVLVMGNLPSALLLVLPLGFLDPTTADLLWTLLQLGCLVASVRMVWIMHGRPKNQLHWLGYSFAPALVCLLSGQVSIFVLFGLVLFLRWHRSRPILAGVSLWLCLLKPHLFLPFGIVMIVWVVITRSYRVFWGTAVALGVSTAIVLILDPLVWVHYWRMMSTLRIDRLPIPCLSIMLRRGLSPSTTWLQYLPLGLGCVWALSYFQRHGDDWDWFEHGSLLTLVSVLVAPYTWLMDQAILIPALLHAAYITRSRSIVAILALASAVIEISALRGMLLLRSEFYLWTTPAWLVLYLFATRRRRATGVSEPLLPVQDALMVTIKD